jgi:hypothetical protein
MIRRKHIYATFGVLMFAMTSGIWFLLGAARASGQVSSTLLWVIASASLITLCVSLALFVTAWNVRDAAD